MYLKCNLGNYYSPEAGANRMYVIKTSFCKNYESMGRRIRMGRSQLDRHTIYRASHMLASTQAGWG